MQIMTFMHLTLSDTQVLDTCTGVLELRRASVYPVMQHSQRTHACSVTCVVLSACPQQRGCKRVGGDWQSSQVPLNMHSGSAQAGTLTLPGHIVRLCDETSFKLLVAHIPGYCWNGTSFVASDMLWQCPAALQRRPSTVLEVPAR